MPRSLGLELLRMRTTRIGRRHEQDTQGRRGEDRRGEDGREAMRWQRESMAERVFDLVAAAVTEPGDDAAEEDEGDSEELASTWQVEPIEELGDG